MNVSEANLFSILSLLQVNSNSYSYIFIHSYCQVVEVGMEVVVAAVVVVGAGADELTGCCISTNTDTAQRRLPRSSVESLSIRLHMRKPSRSDTKLLQLFIGPNKYLHVSRIAH